MATTRTIANAWIDRTLPEIFYEQPEPAEDAVVQEITLDRIKRLLWQRFGGQRDTFISGMFYVAYDETDGNRRVQPDCFIAFDVDAEAVRQNLPNFWVWETGKAPDFVIEVASPSTAANDLGPKRDLYAELRIAEYWLFDPTGGDLYGQPVLGLRLIDGEYQPCELHTAPDGSIASHSELLDLDFHWHDDVFDVLDPKTGNTIDEVVVIRQEMQERIDAERDARVTERDARVIAEARASEERDARLAAEAESAQLREQLRRLKQQD